MSAGRWTIEAYANMLGVSIAEARKHARKNGLIVHENWVGNEFVSSPKYERRHPLNPTR